MKFIVASFYVVVISRLPVYQLVAFEYFLLFVGLGVRGRDVELLVSAGNGEISYFSAYG